jgi:hypothetical protein
VGEELNQSPRTSSHSTAPERRSQASSLFARLPTATRLPATAGDECTGPPVSVAQRRSPVRTSTACRNPSWPPTYSVPSAIRGDDVTAPWVG